MHIFHRGTKALLAGSVAVLTATGLAAGTAGAQTASATTPIIYLAAGNGSTGYSGDGGAAGKAALNTPTGITEDLSGNIYFGDSQNNVVRKVTSSTTGIITTVAGKQSLGPGFSGDGGPATSAQLDDPTGVAIDGSGNIFIADTGNNVIREVVASTGKIKTIAGNGSCGQNPTGNGGPATSASLCVPIGIALDGANLYISDTGHNQVRVVNAAGTISAFAGTGGRGSSGDGGLATKAKLASPTGLAVDTLHDVFVADTGNSKIRVVNSSGIINTFAGSALPGFSGDGGPATSAKLLVPTGLGIDPSGNVYISDTGNNRIRQVNTSNVITTYAGTGVPGYSGDGGPATAAKINAPTGNVGTDGTRVFFSDTGNQRIRAITTGPPPVIAEVSYLLLLPLSTLFLGASGYVIMRRRRRRTPAAAA